MKNKRILYIVSIPLLLLTVFSTSPKATVDDHGDSFATATTITPCEPERGDLEVASDWDMFGFYGEQGTTYTISIELGSLEDSVMYLYDADGATVASDDDGGPHYASEIVWLCETTAAYYIEVGSYQDDFAGGYTLSLTSAGCGASEESKSGCFIAAASMNDVRLPVIINKIIEQVK